MSFALLKTLHMTCAIISGAGFFLRGLLLLAESPIMQQRWVRIVPHMIDTVLLASAITLLLAWNISFLQPWLLAKVIALLVYIGLGMVALRFGKTRQTRALAWLLALLAFGYMMTVAFSKSPLGPLAWLT